MEIDIIEYNAPWYQELIDDCQNLLTEAEFTAKWIGIVARHAIGFRILQDETNFTTGGYTVDGLTQRVATSLERSPRFVQDCIQVAREWADVNEIPVGKNASWRDVLKLLPSRSQEPKKSKEEYILCKRCGSDVPLRIKCNRCWTEFEFEKKDIRKR